MSKENLEKVLTQGVKPKFKINPITSLIKEVAAKAKKYETKKTHVLPVKNSTKQRKVRAIENKYLDINKVSNNHTFAIQPNSIQELINHSHPDIRNLISNSEINKVIATTGKIELTLKNKYKVVIKPVGKYTNYYQIFDHQKTLIFNNKISCVFTN